MQGMQLARELGAGGYFECSAKTGVFCRKEDNNVIEEAVKKILDKEQGPQPRLRDRLRFCVI